MSPEELLEFKRLRSALAERDAMLADRDAQIARLASDLQLLQAHMKRLLAGRGGSHLIAEGQGVLFPDAPPAETDVAADDAADEAESDAPQDDDETPDDELASEGGDRPKSRSRRIDTSALPRVERVHELPEHERVCPETGLPLVAVGEKTFEEIDFQRARVFLVVHRQVVYGLPPDLAEERQVEPLTAPMPPRPLEGCAASAALLGWMLVQKYRSHLPLYRQQEIFERDGLRLPRQTMCDWVLGAAHALEPIAARQMDRIRAGPVMQLDDTPVQCQGGKGSRHFQAYLWTFVNPEVDGVAYRFTPGRASDRIAEVLGDFAGFLVGDGYSGNKAAAEKVPGQVVMAGCWAHTTRKFRDAESEAPGTAKLFRDDIKKLYAIEKEADTAGLDPAARKELRRRKSRTILASLFARGRRLRREFSEAGDMAQAIRYMLNQRRPLRRFLEDGRVPIDNNNCEQSIRPIAVGRRNWLFAGSVRGGHAAAILYTLIESCRLAEVDMVEYLADVLVRVATHPASRIDELLPSQWKAAGAQAVPSAAPVPALV